VKRERRSRKKGGGGGRLFHTAAAMENYMVAMGGRGGGEGKGVGSGRDGLLLYVYQCRNWISVEVEMEDGGDWQQQHERWVVAGYVKGRARFSKFRI
jgi:hypothetical protein